MLLWHVYLLRCRDGSFYCGVTSNLATRLAQHNGLKSGGARYTRFRRPVCLMASIACESKSYAMSLEYAIKQLPRIKKLQFFQLHGVLHAGA